MSQPLVRSDDDGVYIIMNRTIYRPPSPITAAVANEKVSATVKGLVTILRYEDLNDTILDVTEQWVKGESLTEYRAARAEAKLWPEWKDFMGNTYKPGDYVIYAQQWGSSAQLAFAQVVKINRYDSSGSPILRWESGNGRVPSATITVTQIDCSKGARWVTKGKTTIHDPSKVVKIEGSYMEKFAQLETELVDAEVERIKGIYS